MDMFSYSSVIRGCDLSCFIDTLNAIYSCPGSTPLHLAARGGSIDCIRELLAWGADRLQRDSSGYSSIFFHHPFDDGSLSFMYLVLLNDFSPPEMSYLIIQLLLK